MTLITQLTQSAPIIWVRLVVSGGLFHAGAVTAQGRRGAWWRRRTREVTARGREFPHDDTPLLAEGTATE